MKLMMAIGLALICISANAARPTTASSNQAALQYNALLAARTPNTALLKMRMPNVASSRLMLSARVLRSVQPTAQFKGAANVRTSMRGFKSNNKRLLYQNLMQPNQTESDEDYSDYSYYNVPVNNCCGLDN